MPAEQHAPLRLPPPLFYLTGLFFGYSLDRVIKWQLPQWPALYAIAAIAAALGVLLVLTALWAFKRHNTTVLPYRRANTLVSAGPYRITRNPMYVSFSLLHLACALAQLSPGMLLTLPFVCYAVQEHVIKGEETALAKHFGEQWQHYSTKVRRWL